MAGPGGAASQRGGGVSITGVRVTGARQGPDGGRCPPGRWDGRRGAGGGDLSDSLRPSWLDSKPRTSVGGLDLLMLPMGRPPSRRVVSPGRGYGHVCRGTGRKWVAGDPELASTRLAAYWRALQPARPPRRGAPGLRARGARGRDRFARPSQTLLAGGDSGLGVLWLGFESQPCRSPTSSSVTWALKGRG